MGVAFGTDGMRGVANVELTAEVAVSLGRAACAVLGTGTWLVGADTRASGPMLVAALAAGLASAGADVVDLGVLPTPGVAFHAQARGWPAAVVSASHNAWTDNGIKLLASGGRKLTDPLEHAIAVNLTTPGPLQYLEWDPVLLRVSMLGVGIIEHHRRHGHHLPDYLRRVPRDRDRRRHLQLRRHIQAGVRPIQLRTVHLRWCRRPERPVHCHAGDLQGDRHCVGPYWRLPMGDLLRVHTAVYGAARYLRDRGDRRCHL